MEIKWKEITCDNQHFLETVKKFYDQVFTLNVREPHQLFLKSLIQATTGRNNYHLLAGFDGEQLVSFAAGHYFTDVNSGYIVYIATEPYVRGRGIGMQTLQAFEHLLINDAYSAGYANLGAIILETEKADLALDDMSKRDCMKRNHFYEKNQFELCEGISYVQPPLHPGEQPVPLNLFVKNLQNKQSVNQIKELIKVMYREKYERINGIDKLVLEDCLTFMGCAEQMSKIK